MRQQPLLAGNKQNQIIGAAVPGRATDSAHTLPGRQPGRSGVGEVRAGQNAQSHLAFPEKCHDNQPPMANHPAYELEVKLCAGRHVRQSEHCSCSGSPRCQ